MAAARRIAVIHVTTVAMPPIAAAFRELWPDATIQNLLDDSLSPDLDRAGEMLPAFTDRFRDLAAYAARSGADAILFTCTAFDPPIEACQAALDMPVLKPNEAMFEEAIRSGTRIGLLATDKRPVERLKQRLTEAGGATGRKIEVAARIDTAAWDALQARNMARHDASVVDSARALGDADCILLSQFSMAHLAEPVAAATGKPVLTAPHAAVRKLMTLLNAEESWS